MIWLSALLLLAGAQSGDPYSVEDPFALAEPAPVEAAPPAAAPESQPPAQPSPDALICRSRPELGTRTRYRRLCLTALQWEHHENSLEQMRRDINDMGAQGCDRNRDYSNCIRASVVPN